MRQLRHNNLMEIYEIFNTETSLKVVMEIVQGG